MVDEEYIGDNQGTRSRALSEGSTTVEKRNDRADEGKSAASGAIATSPTKQIFSHLPRAVRKK